MAASPWTIERNHRAFSLVELLVVIAIIGGLVSLLLPAVQAAREAGRRMACTNNAKQLGLACHAYHSANNHFPAAVAMNTACTSPSRYDADFGPNWLVTLLPHVEQTALYDEVAASVASYMTSNDSAWRTIRSKRVNGYTCPSDTFNTTPCSQAGGGWERGNYGANAGPGMFYLDTVQECSLTQRNGIFVETRLSLRRLGPLSYLLDSSPRGVMTANSQIRIVQITDGTSKTVLLDELRAATASSDTRGVWAMGLAGASIVAGSGRGDSPGPNVSLTNYDDVHGCVNDPDRGMGCHPGHQSAQVTAKSLHPNGVVICLADGSVRFLTNDVERKVYQLIHSRDDGHAFTTPW